MEVRYFTKEERLEMLKDPIQNKLNRDLTEIEIRHIEWLSSFDWQTCQVFSKLFKDM